MNISEKVIFKYGEKIKVNNVDGARGFISDIDLKSPEKAVMPMAPGIGNKARYLLIINAAALANGDGGKNVKCNGLEYELLHAEPIIFEGAISHWEGILRLKGRCANA